MSFVLFYWLSKAFFNGIPTISFFPIHSPLFYVNQHTDNPFFYAGCIMGIEKMDMVPANKKNWCDKISKVLRTLPSH